MDTADNRNPDSEEFARELAAGVSEDFEVPPVRCTSFLGDNALEFYQLTVAYLADSTGIATEFISGVPPGELDRRVNRGAIQVVFTCGLPYVRKADHEPPLLQLLAAPVMLGARYCDRPVYFSDVIVHAESPYGGFEDLRGTTFAYNEVCSLSGYMLPWYHLHPLAEIDGFFAETIRSGSHAVSMNWVESGRADAAAIDSVVLEMEISQDSERARSLRVIENIGPATMPPVAASTRLSQDLGRCLRQTLLEMHATERGRAILDLGGVRRFAAVTDVDYDPIRWIARALQATGATDLS
jgi:phosphonate transport system substrate-binding protein